MKETGEKLTKDDRDVVKKLKTEYGLRYVHDEELFYKLYKISRKDFVENLQNVDDQDERDQIIFNTIYGVQGSKDAPLGRRGVLTLQSGLAKI